MFLKPGDLAYEPSPSSGLVARVRPADVLYYTAAVEHKDIEVVGGNPLCRGTYLEDDEDTRGSGGALYGPCIYRQVLSGYRKIWKRSGETFDIVELPEARAPVARSPLGLAVPLLGVFEPPLGRVDVYTQFG